MADYGLELATGKSTHPFVIGGRKFDGRRFNMGELRKLRNNSDGIEGERVILAEIIGQWVKDKKPVTPELFDTLDEDEYLELFRYLSTKNAG